MLWCCDPQSYVENTVTHMLALHAQAWVLYHTEHPEDALSSARRALEVYATQPSAATALH